MFASSARFDRLLLACVAFAFGPVPVGAQLYQPGDVVANFTLTDRATGQSVNLHDYAGKIVFLEWFAWWCPFCQAAAAQTVPGVVSVNTNGIPVAHVAVNLQPGQEAQTQAFVNAYGLGQVLNDFNRSVANRFASSGQPIFAVINGVAQSPSHAQWSMVYSHLGYGELTSPIATFNSAINAVRAAVTSPVALPTITQPPLSQTVVSGSPVTLSVTATGDGPLVYQWKRDGVVLAGANAATFTLATASTMQAGDYTVDVSNSAGTTTSRFARLVIAAPVPGRIVNMSVRGPVGVNGEPLIVGLIVDGGPKSMLVRAIGPTLADFNVPGALADPTLTIYAGQASVGANDNWGAGDASALAAAFANVGAFPLDAARLDAATLIDLNGAHTAHTRDRLNGTGIALVEMYDAEDGNTPRLSNVSARNFVGTGADILVAGFVISGNEPRVVLVRGVGPGLAMFGVPALLEDPVLELHTTMNHADLLVATNDNWGDAPNAAAAATAAPGAFALSVGSKDAVLLITLPAGAYTAHVRGAGATTGNALVEIYEVP